MEIVILANLSIATLRLDEWLTADDNHYDVVTTSKKRAEYAAANFAANVTLTYVDDWYAEAALVGQIRRINDHNRIQKIISFRERDVLIAARLRKLFKVPGQRIENAILYRDKVKMKSYLREHGIPVTDFQAIDDLLDALCFIEAHENQYPFVIKPVSGGGSADTSVVHNVAEVMAAVAHHSGEPQMIESFVDGKMYHIDVLRVDHQVRYISTGRYLTDCLAFQHGVSTASAFLPYRTSESGRILAFANATLDVMPVEKDAIFHIEVFENSAGQLVLCEIACRAGGGRIVPLIEHNSHINLYKELLVHQIERDELSDLREGQMHNDKYVGFVLTAPRQGTVVAAPKQVPFEYVDDYEIYTQAGTVYGVPNSSVFATAFFDVHGSSVDEVSEKLAAVDNWMQHNLAYQ
ncbi:ATP-grasp domain-containing protein [Lactiplantibacillus pentosus]|jgi:biotin carboxylase|uniref:ATP-grasp domain-containing protein n=1 Tax=Lactiplantibacillus pentosus TaxID=1589 RepID=UPI00207A5D5B|nr:ATP-grasp domain-containing protein [Lactiplantibacillus pentosus]MDC6398335.1 ATP-grasp domain-containing protein [Lactiplantibacillus pentosus]USJ86655.1 ATP-grasp domain-containing protein [Lactiplantibacillus pentosus]